MANGMTEYATRARLLHDDLHQLRRRADIAATGATLHQLRSCVASAHTALQMAEDRLEGEDTADLDLLLSFAEEALQNARALIAQARDPKPAV